MKIQNWRTLQCTFNTFKHTSVSQWLTHCQTPTSSICSLFQLSSPPHVWSFPLTSLSPPPFHPVLLCLESCSAPSSSTHVQSSAEACILIEALREVFGLLNSCRGEQMLDFPVVPVWPAWLIHQTLMFIVFLVVLYQEYVRNVVWWGKLVRHFPTHLCQLPLLPPQIHIHNTYH